jgi:hypothetical protein
MGKKGDNNRRPRFMCPKKTMGRKTEETLIWGISYAKNLFYGNELPVKAHVSYGRDNLIY